MKRRFKVMTTDSNHSLPIAPNILNRDFYASKVDEKYVGDRSINKKILNISLICQQKIGHKISNLTNHF